jgi:hypothetical protein
VATVMEDAEVTRGTLDRVETIEEVAMSLPDGDARRRLFEVARAELQSTAPVRPRVAAEILEMTEKTIRAWTDEGVLAAATLAPRLLLDPTRLHDVWHLVRDLREAGKTHGLLDEVYRRLSDQSILERPDLQQSLAEMRRGEGRVEVPRPSAKNTATKRVAKRAAVPASAPRDRTRRS